MELKEIIRKINSLKKEYDQYLPLTPEIEGRIMQKFRLEWNFNSNHLEGNQLSYHETKALLLHGITSSSKPLQEYLEVEGHDDAIKYVEEVIAQERPLTEQFIRELHEMILQKPYQVAAQTQDGQPTKKWIKLGEYKTEPNHVLTKTGEMFYFASPEETPAKMGELIDWYRKQMEAKQHPLSLAAEFHYRFITIHPFDDGNGRLARILMNFVLMQMDMPPVIIRSEKKEDYFNVLRQADGGNLEAFYIYIGEQLLLSLGLAIKGAKGEPIEDPDDLDKQLQLLDQRIKNLDEEEIEIAKSNEIIDKILEEVALPLAKKIDSYLEPLKKWFTNYKVNWYHDGNGKYYDNIQKIALSQIFSDAHDRHPHRVGISFDFSGFKKSGTKPFQVATELRFEFLEYSYTIVQSQTNKVFRDALYHQLPLEDELKDIARETAKYIIEEVGYRIDNLKKDK
ncbi:MAG: hypothetical protein COW03_13395 [Cytophagales bacterium CG12_big_fil_rev_8_21_14_0_65_40_12]|nr:MAG: hypothetical protein COW03_13395 [Cytophagales bacterium CG12_big_fil_rev_8_21_14_0_65_40_12]PIW03128.1 MAG: hypothetical protein COW40_17470 [Cytophagales bacterium CG17_big_fil_post_rev_8_21_14_2_50_40_13]